MSVESLRIPLLRDHHSHPLLYAAFMDGLDLNADPPESRGSAVERIRSFGRGNPGWSIVHGWNSGRFGLSKTDFDDLPPLVIFNLSLHGLIVNEAGRALLGRTDPMMSANLDDAAWTERHLLRILNTFASDGASPERLQRFYGWLLERHSVHYAEEMLLVDEREISLYEEAGLAGRTRFWAAPDIFERLSRAAQEKVHGIKLFTDGALGVRTAALHTPYRDSDDRGLLIYDSGELEALLDRYRNAGRPLAVHAIGDRAIDQFISAVEAVRPLPGSEIRMEHAQFISETTARRARVLGVSLCMQPNFSDDSLSYRDRLPEGYAERNNPFRMLIDRIGYVPGVDLVFGSDGMPHGVDEGLRQSLFPPHPGQTLTLDEFIAGYCLESMDSGFVEVRIDRTNRSVASRDRSAVAGQEDP